MHASIVLAPVQIPNDISIGSAVFAQLTLNVRILYNGPLFSSKWPIPVGDLDPIKYMIPWAHPSPKPKRHLDWFCRFAGLTTVTQRQTDRPTDHATRSVTVGRIKDT